MLERIGIGRSACNERAGERLWKSIHPGDLGIDHAGLMNLDDPLHKRTVSFSALLDSNGPIKESRSPLDYTGQDLRRGELVLRFQRLVPGSSPKAGHLLHFRGNELSNAEH